MLRDYQQRAIDQLYAWFNLNKKGHPCLELPTGSGKSHIIAALCKDAIENWPETRILMLTHVKELIEQNAEKMWQHWPTAPLGIYSAGLKRKQLDQQITFAGIQSIRNHADKVGYVDLIIIDEAHLVNHRDTGSYRTFIEDLKQFNPDIRVIGLTATPYRLGHGLITDEPALFQDIISPVTIEELIFKGYLAPLRSKATELKVNVSGVHKRGGEFIESELYSAVAKFDSQGAVDEVIRRAEGRKSWLFFCSGVEHAEKIRDILRDKGISAECVLGDTPKAERERILEQFKSGEITALTNANVLTTGFDHPDLDVIVMLRPTLSTALYCQMAGRGMRIKKHAEDCLVFDFAGVIATHGPITALNPKKPNSGNGEAPVKTCEVCSEINHLAVRACTSCGHPFPIPKPPKMKLHNEDIMGMSSSEMNIKQWRWSIHKSRNTGREMILVTYYGLLSDPPVREYLTVEYDGYAGQKARRIVSTIAQRAGVSLQPDMTMEDLTKVMNRADCPSVIKYCKSGKFYQVSERLWHEERALRAS